MVTGMGASWTTLWAFEPSKQMRQAGTAVAAHDDQPGVDALCDLEDAPHRDADDELPRQVLGIVTRGARRP